VAPGNAPDFFDLTLTEEEMEAVREQVRRETEAIKGQGIKTQHFAAAFERLPGLSERTVLLFLYLTKSGEGMRVKEIPLDLHRAPEPPAQRREREDG
jgi:anaerobic magnesium-protoporphyrin IX monomethyl ester cyclase